MSEVSPSAAKFYGDGEPDIDKQLDWLIQEEEKAEQEKSEKGDMDDAVTEDNIDKLLAEDDPDIEKGQAETAGTGKEEDGSGEPAEEKGDSTSPDVSSSEPESGAGEAAHDAEDKTSPSVAAEAEVEGASSPQPVSREEDGDDYTLTDDQRQAMAELDNMKGDPEYDYLPDEDPPEYDVTERIKQLNAELETDGVPVDGEREVKVGFKENLVDLVAPPPVFSDDEDDHEKEKETNQNNDSANEDTQKPKSKENKVLIERDGKFDLVDSDDPLAAEYGGLPYEAGAGDSSLSPSPPSQPRPATATGFSRQQRQQPQWRAQSAHISRDQEQEDWSGGYKSPYGLSEAQKAIKQERDKALLRRQRAEAERKKREEEEKREENEGAFQVWLKGKREDAARRRQQEKEAVSRKQKTVAPDNEGALKKWLQDKAAQKQKERKMESEKMKEVQDGYYYRTRKDCDKAYKAWLKKKNAEMTNSKDYKKKKQSIAMLYLRRSRKSQALARAIQYSQSFRYVDYYGYRM